MISIYRLYHSTGYSYTLQFREAHSFEKIVNQVECNKNDTIHTMADFRCHELIVSLRSALF